MPTATVLDLLTNALIGIRVARLGAPLPPEQAQHALDALNLLLETWTVGKQHVYRASEVIASLSGAQMYTIGPSGAINTIPRPSAIRAGFTRIGGNDYAYTPISEQVYTAIGYKAQGGTAPTVIYYELAVPLGVLHVWPVSSGELHLMCDAALGPLALNDTLSFPEGYAGAIQLALGEQEADVYGQTLSDTYRENLRKAETAIRRRNHQGSPVATVAMPGSGRTRDRWYIYSGGGD